MSTGVMLGSWNGETRFAEPGLCGRQMFLPAVPSAPGKVPK
jgi:hypothetical protein